MTSLRRIPWLRLALLAAVVIVIAACSAPTGSGHPSPSPAPPLTPAPLKPDPFSVLAWLFTPIFQVFLLLMVGIYLVVSDIGVAIVITTLVVRTAMVPLMRRQMVSMRQMQAIQPELKEIQRRYKADRTKQQQAISELYKERGISQAGCLVSFLSIFLLFPMYQVVREGLVTPDPNPMLSVFGFQLFHLDCSQAIATGKACLDTSISWLGGINAAGFEGLIPLPVIGGISVFAIVYTVFQLVASRMALPSHDPNTPIDSNARTQRAMSLWLPLITLLYSTVIPVGLFIYLIVSTIYQIGQQFLTTGWGGMFPLFGRTPAFAVGHTPRFPVATLSATQTPSTTRGPTTSARPTPERSVLDRSASASSTIRQRGRQGRRGRRR